MKLFTLLLISSTALMAQSVYHLQKGETLSELLYKYNKKPLYGKNNWVEKTLKLNRITLEEANNLEEGSAVMLPVPVKKEIVKVDVIKVRQSAIGRAGLIGGRVSSHQNLYFHLDYFYQKAVMGQYSADLQENFGLGVEIIGRNNYQFEDFKWNAFGGFYSANKGAARFEEYSNKTARFSPDALIFGGLQVRPDNAEVELTLRAALEEVSLLSNQQTNVDVDRHLFSWVGIGAKHTLERGRYIFNNSILFEASLFHNEYGDNLDNQVQSTRTSYHSSVNLTKMTHAGIFMIHQRFNNTELFENNSFGLRLTTDLK
jgi:hypothetical protein